MDPFWEILINLNFNINFVGFWGKFFLVNQRLDCFPNSCLIRKHYYLWSRCNVCQLWISLSTKLILKWPRPWNICPNLSPFENTLVSGHHDKSFWGVFLFWQPTTSTRALCHLLLLLWIVNPAKGDGKGRCCGEQIIFFVWRNYLFC